MGQLVPIGGDHGRHVGDDSPPYRTPPHNFEAEMALLGAVLFDNHLLDKLALTLDHFADPAHGRIFEAVVALVAKGQVADPITLKDYFEQDGELSDIGGTPYLAKLVEASITAINATDYAAIIQDRYLRRRLIDLAEDVTRRAYTFTEENWRTEERREAPSAQSQIDLAQGELMALAGAGEADGQAFAESLDTTVAEAEAAQARGGALVGITTGFVDLDSRLGGLRPGQYVVLGGRPSMGKTTFLTNIALHNLARDRRVAFFSLEMSAAEITALMLARRSGISAMSMLRGKMADDGIGRIRAARDELSNLPLLLDDAPSLPVAEISARAQKFGAELVIVDHLDLAETGGKFVNDYMRVSAVSKALKQAAKRLAVPLIAAHQLSRRVEDRPSKRPSLSDLRDSGKIEADADVILFLFRREYYLKRDEPEESEDEEQERKRERWEKEVAKAAGKAEIIVAKQRMGPTDSKINLTFNGSEARFDNWAKR